MRTFGYIVMLVGLFISIVALMLPGSQGSALAAGACLFFLGIFIIAEYPKGRS